MVSAFSIGTSKRSTEKIGKNDNPGPGNYNPETIPKESSPSWRMGTSLRPKIIHNMNPGPGNYDIPSIINTNPKASEGPKFSFGMRVPHHEEMKNINPGPGTYDYKFPLESEPKYSFGAKTDYDSLVEDQKSKSFSPGPGYYDTNISTVTQIPIFRFGRSPRDQKSKNIDMPGPGAYDFSKTSLNSSPKFMFGKSNRDQGMYTDTLTKTVPGPGTYKLDSILNTQIGITLRGKRNDNSLKEPQLVPGPGAYDVDGFKDILEKSPSYKIGGQARSLSPRGDYKPGPGHYTPSDKVTTFTSPNFRIGSSKRPPVGNENDLPGPGTYNPPEMIVEGPRYGQGKSRRDLGESLLRQEAPGPGTYNAKFDVTKEKILEFRIGNSNRHDFVKKSVKVPGPGTYNLIDNLDELNDKKKYKTNGIGFKFDKNDRGFSPNSKIVNAVPGPGTYDVKPFFADVPKYLLATGKPKIQI